MSIHRVLAGVTVTELEPAVAWYTLLFGGGPDDRPMPGLAEWHLAETFGVQVFAEPDRAGHSSLVLDETDLDGRVVALDQAGLDYDGPSDATTTRILMLADPDGNRIVFTGPLG